MAWGCFAVLALTVRVGRAELVPAAAREPVEVAYPEGAPPLDVQVTLELSIDADGNVAAADEVVRVPADAPQSFVTAAVAALRRTPFGPTTRDGRAVRSRIRYVVAFHPPPLAGRAAPPPPPTSINESDEDYVKEVQVLGTRRASPRGLGDLRIKRELLVAAPHAQAGELLSAAPGWFADHEDAEGLANDVLLRGFDLEHGAGIEMKVGAVPINLPLHVQGQGYADPSFIIPEVVRSVRVQSGPYDPRQGDAAIAGSAQFDLGVIDRGYRVQASYGSFDQVRLVAIAAPRDHDEETFAAVAVRKSDGFGDRRASRSGTAIAQIALDVGPRDHLRVLGTAHGARADQAGVVRQDDLDAARIGFDDSYPQFTQGSGVQSARVIVGVDFDHLADNGAHFELAPWLMWTDFRARQNFSGNLETSREDPTISGLGDLFETTNRETAAGAVARWHAAPWRAGTQLEVVAEPGLVLRFGRGEQTKSLIVPSTLAAWDHRLSERLRTLDAAAYLDLDVRLFERLRVSGGVRADALTVAAEDRLRHPAPGRAPTTATPTDVAGVVVSPRVTMELAASPELSPVLSWGEGFRSLDVTRLSGGSTHPYSKVRSFEGGLRMQALAGRYTSTVTGYTTYVGNELVFEASSGGLVTERASTRSGMVLQIITNPARWLLVATALSLTRATFTSDAPGRPHNVPNVPAVVYRTDAAVHGVIGRLGGAPVTARAGVGYTFLSRRHLTDAVTGPASHVLNASAALSRGALDVGIDAYNVLGLRYADDAAVYVSNFSANGGRSPASVGTHITAAPPRTVLLTASLGF